jgi:hypothetical protein
MPTMISVRIRLPVSSVLSAYYCLDSDLAGDAPALNVNSGDDDLRFDASQTPASNASSDDKNPSRNATDHRSISPLQRVEQGSEIDGFDRVCRREWHVG